MNQHSSNNLNVSQFSLGKKVVKYVFSLYLLVACIVTIVQMIIEFERVQNTLIEEMHAVSQTISPGLSEQLWNLDDEGVSRALKRIVLNEKILGIEITDKKRKPVSHSGRTKTSTTSKEGLLNKLVGVEFSLDYNDPYDNAIHNVGHGIIYTGTSVAISQVKYGFILIIINSLVKTAALWLITVYFISKLIEKPLKKLEEMTRSFDPSADHEKQIDHSDDAQLRSQKDQLGRLMTSYEEMQKKIRNDFHLIKHQKEVMQKDADALNEYKNDLERLVGERTQELSLKEAQLRMALDNMPGAMSVVDNELNIVLINEKYQEFYGGSTGLLTVGTNISNILESEIQRGLLSGDGSPKKVLEERLQSFTSGHVENFEDCTSDGRYIQLTRTPAPDGHVISVAIDVTGRKKNEEIISNAMDLINESLKYASRIQRSILPVTRFIEEDFADHFVLWEPRDIVGGDLYWYRKVDGGFLLAVGDCTGHGVPGAFLTMIATGALDRALRDHPKGDPDILLNVMHRSVQHSLGQNLDDGESDDGLEIGICRINSERTEMQFAGSRFSLFSMEKTEISEIKGEKSGIGYRRIPLDQTYTKHTVALVAKTSFYMTSDGLIDQIGGERRLSFGKKRFKRLLLENKDHPMQYQKAALQQALTDYQGDEIRRDDVTVVGFIPKEN